jgi:hypothetical protein
MNTCILGKAMPGHINCYCQSCTYADTIKIPLFISLLGNLLYDLALLPYVYTYRKVTSQGPY